MSQPLYDAVTTAQPAAAGANSLSWTHVGSSPYGIGIVIAAPIGNAGAVTVSGITWDTIAMTQIAAITGLAGNVRLEAWGLVNPGSTGNIVASFSGTCRGGATSHSVKGGTGFGATATWVNSPYAELICASDASLVVGGCVTDSGTRILATSQMTQLKANFVGANSGSTIAAGWVPGDAILARWAVSADGSMTDGACLAIEVLS